MNQKKAFAVAEAIFELKVHDELTISLEDGKIFHVECSPFMTRKQNETLIEISKQYKIHYELARDGFDLW